MRVGVTQCALKGGTRLVELDLSPEPGVEPEVEPEPEPDSESERKEATILPAVFEPAALRQRVPWVKRKKCRLL